MKLRPSEATTICNPFRYKDYYYDIETGWYYLNSRYYDPEAGRFISPDSVEYLGADGSPLSYNRYVYCGNNPVNRIDPLGKAWWHWVLGAGVVAACAVVTVVTCGGFAAAGAIGAVSSGAVAATSASTIAAGATIGSATVYGMAALTAVSGSNTITEFNNQGNWGTVIGTVTGAVWGGASAYSLIRSTNSLSRTYSSRGSSGRASPMNLKEQLAMEQVRSNPLNNAIPLKINLNDPRWPAIEGWIKMANNVNGIEIHFVYNFLYNLFDDFKFGS